jgi:hypothetical protein
MAKTYTEAEVREITRLARETGRLEAELASRDARETERNAERERAATRDAGQQQGTPQQRAFPAPTATDRSGLPILTYEQLLELDKPQLDALKAGDPGLYERSCETWLTGNPYTVTRHR